MKLGQGITTVVGPNGCGKTNIVDAIRWVLGEQKYSILRSGKMEDVIFNGAEGTKPLGVCEVSMTVHNNAGKLPIEYNDIEIARRIYRSGESEYYLNKTQCRLKDIMNLFVDTGMGADAYSVIELKMIEQILSETADERRKMFEEAAGIHKYRSQKKSTIRKFEATHSDLERVKDIITEVEQKVYHLELQLKRFKRHEILTETIEVKDKELAYIQIHRLRLYLSPLNVRIDEYKNLRKNKSNKSSVYEKKINQMRDTYKNQESDLNDYQNQMNKINEKRDLLRNRVLVSTEQARGALLTIDRLEREKSNNFQKIENLKQLKLDFDKEIIELNPTIENQLYIYKNKKSEFNEIEINYKKTIELLDKAQNDRWELQRKIADEKSFFQRTKELIEIKKLDISTFNKNISFQKKESKLLINNTKIVQKEQVAYFKNIEKQEKKINSIEKTLNNLINERNKIIEEKHSSSAIIGSLNGQLEFYNELIDSGEGFPEGTRFVLENPKLFPNILGTVADMFQVDDVFRDALESGLGDLSHCLIAKDKVSAISAIKKANDNDAGDLTIIPLKEASEFRLNKKEKPEIDEILAQASDIVKTSKELRPLVNYLLGDLLIVRDLSAVIDSNDFIGWNIVDLAGTFSGQNLIFKNRQVSEHGYMIGRRKKLEMISSELIKLQIKEKKIKKNISSISNKIKIFKRELNERAIKLNGIKKNSSDIGMEIVRSEMIINQNEDNLKSTLGNLNSCELELKHAEKTLNTLRPKIKKINIKLSLMQDKVDAANNHMTDARKQRDDFQNLLQEIKIKLIELESRRDQLKFKKSSGEDTSDELKLRQEKIKQEIKELNETEKSLKSNINKDDKELEVINAEIQKQRSVMELKQEVFRETYQNIEELQVKMAAEQRNQEELLENLKNSELEAAETNQRIKSIQDLILDRYNSKVPDDMTVDLSEEQLELEIKKMQKSIDNIGPINMAVQDEYNEEIERLDILSSQRDDLIDSEDNLRETIRRIDKVARKRFHETFDLIKRNFETLFNLFFEGGNATLMLTGDPDPLDANISIQAQPPGKRNTSLRLLSSGEKALTAISLLFAIYQVKPSPYCILDEVDAPLDDVNIHKFTRVLGKFCDETQFIIVTHNKLTMEIADYMYGVTQEKKGISKLVSVKFD